MCSSNNQLTKLLPSTSRHDKVLHSGKCGGYEDIHRKIANAFSIYLQVCKIGYNTVYHNISNHIKSQNKPSSHQCGFGKCGNIFYQVISISWQFLYRRLITEMTSTARNSKGWGVEYDIIRHT